MIGSSAAKCRPTSAKKYRLVTVVRRRYSLYNAKIATRARSPQDRRHDAANISHAQHVAARS
jgi:hypothetical protein